MRAVSTGSIDPPSLIHATATRDLAVWQGAQPATDAQAMREFHRLSDAFFSGGRDDPAWPQIQSYVARLVRDWRDVDGVSADDEDSPWVHRPVIRRVSGPLLYLSMRSDRAAALAPSAAALAAEMGLVCVDPNVGVLR